MREWAAVAYNPLSCKPDRLQHILRELDFNTFLGLQGTNRWASADELEVRQFKVGKYHVYDFPCRPGCLYTQRGAGVIVALHGRAFSPRNVVKVISPPKEFSGRVGGVRVKRKDADFCFLSVYVPVEPHKQSEQRLVARLWSYVDWVISQLPGRCVPIILCDANGRVGSIPSDGVGVANAQRENYNGSHLRRLVDQQHLVAVNTFFPIGHTWRGNMGTTSRIDYVVLPQSLFANVSCCRLLHRSAAKLQCIGAPGWRDHKPVQVIFQHTLAYQSTCDCSLEHVAWDKDRLVRDLLYGDRRESFLREVEMRCMDSAWDSVNVNDPNTAWAKLNQTVYEAAKTCYVRKAAVQRERRCDTVLAFERMVDARTEMVQAPPARRIFQLGSGAPMFEDMRVMLERWRLVACYWRRRREHDKLCRRDRLQRDMSMVHEFSYYYRTRQMSNMWQLARRLSGKSLGPKRRRYDKPIREQPDKAAWGTFMAQSGPDGGCQAVVTSYTDRATNDQQPERSAYMDRAIAAELAHQDMHDISKRIWQHKLRKAVPPWSAPAEVWRMLFRPDWFLRRPLYGVGFCPPSNPTFHFRRRFFHLLVTVRMYNTTPLLWNTSFGHKIGKNNKKDGCAAVRVVNCLDPVGKGFYTTMWARGWPQSYRHYASGYISHKSRLDAIVQQHVVAFRARQAGVSYCKSFFDVANAFNSPSHDILGRRMRMVVHRRDFELMRQRYACTAVCIDASDGLLCISPQTGALQGDCCASSMFLEVYHPCLDDWLDGIRQKLPDTGVQVVDPINDVEVDVSVSSYADDVAKLSVFARPSEMPTVVGVLNGELDRALATATMAQNKDKQEHVVSFSGKGSHDNFRWALGGQLLPGTTTTHSKYLGGIQHFKHCADHELDEREHAARSSWLAMGRFWSRSGLPRSAICIVFAGMVVAPLLSGLEALVLTMSQFRRLDAFIQKYGRKLMRGAACEKQVLPDGSIKYLAASAQQVWHYLRLVPCRIELRIRRLRWLQSMVSRPALHSNVLAAMFGRFPWDNPQRPRCSTDTNPWASQLLEDVQALDELDSGRHWVTSLQDNLFGIFAEYRHEFLLVDTSELRSKFRSHEVPPPGWCMPSLDIPDEPAPADDGMLYKCECCLDDGSVCGETFPSKQQLVQHMRWTRGGTHGELPQYFRATITNQCPWCRNVFANIRTARQHVRASLQRKRCTGRGSFTVLEPVLPADYMCPECDFTAISLDQLHDHVVTHFGGPHVEPE